MARVLVLLCLCLLAGCLAETQEHFSQKTADPTWAQRQLDLMELFYHIHEPNYVKEHLSISTTWDIEKNIVNYKNVTAVKIYINHYEFGLLPRGVPFSILEPSHRFEAETFFHVLHSAKDYDTFFKTAVWARDHVNEGMFIYVLSVAILNRQDTQGIVIPPLYEITPNFFNNGQIMNTVERINTHYSTIMEHYPHTYTKDGDVVIKANYTFWPYFDSEERLVAYFTHDHGLNAFYYNRHLIYPFWLGGDVVPLHKDRRGEWFIFLHKQILSRYYMERLSNGLGEIPELTWTVPIKEGFDSGLLYHSGIPLPVRPDHHIITCPENVEEINHIEDYERRIRDAIDRGYVINNLGEHVSLRTSEAIDVLGNIIEANVDSSNVQFYRDFISIWKILLGKTHHIIHHQVANSKLVVPSVLENYHTALRDPAFYMIWKRIFNLVEQYQEHLPLYKPEELALPSVQIHTVEVDKLLTYFENTYMNVTSHLYMNNEERKTMHQGVNVLVERPRLNHKKFQMRINVKSDAAKTVVVRVHLAPKYDSNGIEIPLHDNRFNFMMLDQFTFDLKQGDNVITRDSTDNLWTIEDWTPAHEMRLKALSVLQGGKVMLDMSQRFDGLPDRLTLPKGRVNGMPFVLMVHISEYHAPKVPYGTGFDPAVSLGLGSGARFMSDEPMGYPLDRPLYEWQVRDLTNIHFTDVLIYHKHTPELYVPHME